MEGSDNDKLPLSKWQMMIATVLGTLADRAVRRQQL